MENKANIYVGVTDGNWFNHLANSLPDELNFWTGREAGLSGLKTL